MELARTQVDSGKQEYDRALALAKSRHTEELHELIAENQALHMRIEDGSKDRDTARQLRRDTEEARRRLSEAQQEAVLLRRDRDQLKIERNEMLIKNAKEVEEERN